MTIFKGSGVALVTPFENSRVNFNKLEELIEWHIEEKTDAIIICGTTGEAVTMTDEEKKETIKFTVEKVNKRIPVIAGTGSNNTLSAIEMSKYAENVGCDGLLIINPYYNKANSRGFFEHFKAINDAVKTPIIIYNVPSRTAVNISTQNLEKLSKLSNVVAVKEASSNLSQVAQISAKLKIDIYSGCDDLIVPIMSLGGLGVISVLANIIPNTVHKMTSLCLDNKFKEAGLLQLETLELANNLFIETSPVPVKTALNMMGKNVGNTRLPLGAMENTTSNILKETLKKYKLI